MDLQLACSAVVLADGDAHGVGLVTELAVNGQALLDITSLLFAARPTIFDRELRTKTVTFAIERQHATPAAALAWHLTADESFAGVFDLVLTFVEGVSSYVWTMADAGWETVGNGDLNGVATRTLFRVTGGAFVLMIDGAQPEVLDGGGYASSFGPALGVLDAGHYRDENGYTALELEGGAYA